jgi:hypothetical protein
VSPERLELGLGHRQPVDGGQEHASGAPRLEVAEGRQSAEEVSVGERLENRHVPTPTSRTSGTR